MRRLAALLWSALLLAFLVEVSPHLVHHAFDPEHVGEDCPFAASAERAPTAVGPVTVLTAPAPPAVSPVAVADVTPPRLATATVGARAPPTASS